MDPGARTLKNVLPAPVRIPVSRRSGRVEYELHSSHPSSGFAHLLMPPIPAVGVRVPDSGAMGFFAIVRQGWNPADPGVNHFANR